MFEDGSDPYGHPNTDWNDEAYRTGLLHKHNVSITGGAENVKYMGFGRIFRADGYPS